MGTGSLIRCPRGYGGLGLLGVPVMARLPWRYLHGRVQNAPAWKPPESSQAMIFDASVAFDFPS